MFEIAATRHTSTVLLAEDDDAFRHLVAAALRRDGFDVIEARDGRELVTKIASLVLAGEDGHGRCIDLIISDVRMPALTGMQALAGLRRADWTTPVILMTAFGDDETRSEAGRLGAGAVFDKPFDVNDLRTMALHLAGRERCAPKT